MQSSRQIQHNGRKKSIFINDPTDKFLFIEDVLQIAKAQALKLGFAEKELLRVVSCEYDSRAKGWNVVVQAIW